MQSNTKGIVITIAAILVISFFLPWITLFVGISAWDIVFGGIGQYADTPFKYLSILIPVSGALIVYGAAFNNERYALPKGLLFLLPLLTLIVLAVALVIKMDENASLKLSDFNGITSILGIGFWLTLIASIILPFLRSRPIPRAIAIPVTTTDQPVENIAVAPAGTSYSGRTKAGIVLLLAGLVMIILSTQDKLFTKTYDETKAGDLSEAFNMMGNMFNGEANIDTKKKNAVLYSGVAALIIGGVLAATGSAKPKQIVINPDPGINQNNP